MTEDKNFPHVEYQFLVIPIMFSVIERNSQILYIVLSIKTMSWM